jgi:hypothetical protein
MSQIDTNTDSVTAVDLLDMTPEQVHEQVAAGVVSIEAFCQWFDAQTSDSQADGYASGWQDGHSDGFDQGYEDGYDSGYETGSGDALGDSELEIDDETGQVK